MGASGGFPIDLILFGMIAAFLLLRLRSILGKRSGYERPPQPVHPREVPLPPDQPHAVPGGPTAAVSGRVIPEPVTALGQTLAQMRSIDRNFTPEAFLDGAEKAFQIIVKAFAAGDRAALRPLLNDETWNAFDLGITEREQAGQTHITDIKAVHAVTIDAAHLNGSVASITVKFVSDQVNMTLSKSGQVVSGTDAVTEIIDLWTLERDLKQANPTWRLVAARSA